MDRKCETCEYLTDRRISDCGILNGACRRNPKFVPVAGYEWCGEWRAKATLASDLDAAATRHEQQEFASLPEIAQLKIQLVAARKKRHETGEKNVRLNGELMAAKREILRLDRERDELRREYEKLDAEYCEYINNVESGAQVAKLKSDLATAQDEIDRREKERCEFAHQIFDLTALKGVLERETDELKKRVAKLEAGKYGPPMPQFIPDPNSRAALVAGGGGVA